MKLQRNRVYNLDCRKGFRLLRENDIKVSSIITSPPYWNLRAYEIENIPIWDGNQDCSHNFKIKEDSKQKGMCKKCGAWKGQLGAEPTPELYIKHLCDIFTEAKDVLRDDGTLWVNLGDTYREKSLQLIPQRFAIEMMNRGWILRNVIIWYKPNPMPESATDRFTNDFEYFYFFSKNKQYFFKQQFEELKESSKRRAMRGMNQNKWNTGNPLPKGVHSPSIIQPREYKGYENMGKEIASGNTYLNPNGRNKRAVWEITTKNCSESHFAVFPKELIETPIKASTPKYICQKCDKPITDKENHKCNSKTSVGIVLDPFAGIGTTLLKAFELGRDFIGFEISKKYWKMGKKKIQKKCSFKRLDSF